MTRRLACSALRYSGSGSAWQFGQGYQAGTAWPKLNVPSNTLYRAVGK